MFGYGGFSDPADAVATSSCHPFMQSVRGVPTCRTQRIDCRPAALQESTSIDTSTVANTVLVIAA